MFNYKQLHQALTSHVEALTKDKKEKENISIDLELINLKSVSLLNSKEIITTTIEEKIEKLVEKKKKGLEESSIVVGTTKECK